MRAADAALYRAKRNGGGQIFTAGTRASDVAPRHERRTMRRTTQERLREAVRELSDRFAGDLADEAPLQRLEAVAVALSEALNTAAWSISFAPDRRRDDPHGLHRRRPRQAPRGAAPGARQRGLLRRRVPGYRGAARGRRGRLRRARRRPIRRPRRAHAAGAAGAHQRPCRRPRPTTRSRGCWSCTRTTAPRRWTRRSWRPPSCCARRSRRARPARARRCGSAGRAR